MQPKLPSKLSESLHRQLNSYSLAARAAGVGMLALTQPCEARIVYTPANRHIGYGLTKLDLDKNDGLRDADFEFCLSRFSTGSDTSRHPYSCPSAFRRGRKPRRPPEATGSALSIYPHGGKKNMKNRIWGSVKGAYALPKGVSIGPKINFTPGGKDMATWVQSHGTTYFFGPWAGAKNRYLAFKFAMKGEIHYGWARLTVVSENRKIKATLTGYAYETIPGKSIKTGQTFDILPPTPDSLSPDDPGPDASLTNPIPDNSQPPSLGLIALGAPGIAIWRRKESVDARP